MTETRTCGFQGCEKPYKARGVCAAHYAQFKAGKQLTPVQQYSKEDIVERDAAKKRHPLYQDAK